MWSLQKVINLTTEIKLKHLKGKFTEHTPCVAITVNFMIMFMYICSIYILNFHVGVSNLNVYFYLCICVLYVCIYL